MSRSEWHLHREANDDADRASVVTCHSLKLYYFRVLWRMALLEPTTIVPTQRSTANDFTDYLLR